MLINLNPELFSWAFYKINIYGVCALVAITVFYFFLHQDLKKNSFISSDFLLQIILELFIVGFLSAKFLFLIFDSTTSGWTDFARNPFAGFSQLGPFIGLPLYLWIRLKFAKINFWGFVNFLAYRIPILQAIGRLGCLFAGCCVGIPAKKSALGSIFSVTYCHQNSLAPQNIALIPTQLMSIIFSLFLITIFWILKKKSNANHNFFGLLLIGEGCSRFFTDFWRLDRSVIIFYNFSNHQILALSLIFIGLLICKSNQKLKLS